jgi:hypothetical protein
MRQKKASLRKRAGSVGPEDSFRIPDHPGRTISWLYPLNHCQIGVRLQFSDFLLIPFDKGGQFGLVPWDFVYSSIQIRTQRVVLLFFGNHG